jgi:hypothetical protein
LICPRRSLEETSVSSPSHHLLPDRIAYDFHAWLLAVPLIDHRADHLAVVFPNDPLQRILDRLQRIVHVQLRRRPSHTVLRLHMLLLAETFRYASIDVDLQSQRPVQRLVRLMLTCDQPHILLVIALLSRIICFCMSVDCCESGPALGDRFPIDCESYHHACLHSATATNRPMLISSFFRSRLALNKTKNPCFNRLRLRFARLNCPSPPPVPHHEIPVLSRLHFTSSYSKRISAAYLSAVSLLGRGMDTNHLQSECLIGCILNHVHPRNITNLQCKLPITAPVTNPRFILRWLTFFLIQSTEPLRFPAPFPPALG